jgi:fluoroquinolone resistance protein
MVNMNSKKSATPVPQELYDREFTSSNDFQPAGQDFTKCKFSHCDLTGLHFDGILDACLFQDCNLSLTSFESAKLQGVSFLNSKLVGVDFTRCHTLGLVLSFKDCLITSCNFNFIALKKTSFCNCQLQETDFVGTDLQESNFTNAVLRAVTFHNTNLTKADFTGAQGYLINPLTNSIKGAKFALPEAVSLLECMGVNLK